MRKRSEMVANFFFLAKNAKFSPNDFIAGNPNLNTVPCRNLFSIANDCFENLFELRKLDGSIRSTDGSMYNIRVSYVRLLKKLSCIRFLFNLFKNDLNTVFGRFSIANDCFLNLSDLSITSARDKIKS